MQLLLVRHAQPATVRDAPDGVADPGLTASGRLQAGAVAGWLAAEGVDHVVASPARRAVETAGPLAAVLGVEPAVREPLLEYDFGGPDYVQFDGPFDEHPAYDVWRPWLGPVDPDSPVADYRRRVTADLRAVAAANRSRTVAVVSHGGTMNAFLAEVLGTPTTMVFAPSFTGVCRVLVDRDGRCSVRSVNETAHLRGVPGSAG